MCISKLTFRLSDEYLLEASAAFAEHERRIREQLPEAEIRHTGGTSIPGVLTSGDVDLQVRVDREGFEPACGVLSELYEPHYPDAWHSDGAFFVAIGSQPPVVIALTAIGTLDDLHHGDAWRRIAADARLIERYNMLKRAHEGGSVTDYNAAKGAFFREHFRL